MPEVEGFVAPGFEAVGDAFAANFADGAEIGAAVSVYAHGRPVVDLWGGIADPETGRPWEQDTSQVVYSTTKAATTACALLLVQRGELDLDAPVAAYWPEFAAEGKQELPVRWLLTHQAGLVAVDRPVARADALAWHPIVEALAAQRPQWQPGTRHGYHALTYGWLVGEVVRRVSGRTLGTFLHDEIARPLDLDFHIGLPKSEQHRVSRLVLPPVGFDQAAVDLDQLPEPVRALASAFADPNSLTRRAYGCVEPSFDHNDPDEQAAEIPATNGICTARALAGFYAALIGEVDGHRVLTPATLAAATTPHTSGPDLVTLQPFRVGLGFGLPAPAAAWYSPASFGFGGLGGSLGYADPVTGLAFGYVMNHIRNTPTAEQPAANLITALRSTFDS
ncbi:serine hydrolase domain-containing protein [Kibdelosporangium phytohabitans]|uniref:Esterase n=1 Tax=Kibdelosporangium phytohabitans TaxID=860235 RepID=A0A0N9I6M4_9PSEU|nr:serine hydrolase domain-containing protein [Kibdelosporangium phytohabitans]ALG10545.1 esterase [Kibdelosporangium phytohabitans]MBE1461644.1 CubicO group peptidase (beta-lactamase class C family) [Kibdelosporangium phytohabitans]